MTCKICGKEFRKAVNPYPETDIDLSLEGVCSWLCYLKECANVVDEADKIINNIEKERLKKAEKPKVETVLTEEDIKKKAKMIAAYKKTMKKAEEKEVKRSKKKK